ncbi:structural maintenance of chromosomes protein 4-like [Sinocyclocheilus grahami]|uniref:structural maintenance of chromosomes protein 4-like n=1 Tax=Sinocyclocheilus grahami TaxID=75366 RepID=UPI0007AD61B7|nr:PREDICTED: structural maintenance of chromosomes protein 4-like [Sinocyclocheilus grahami]
MPAKTKSSTAAKRAVESNEEQSAARRPPSAAAEHGETDASPGESAEELDNRSLEEILTSIPPPPPPAMSSEPGAPRLMITHIVNRNFKSYAGEQILGPFHKVSAARLLHVFESAVFCF